MSFALLAHGAAADEVDRFAEHHLVERPIIVLGQDTFQAGIRHLDRAIASSISLPTLGCLALA